MNVLEWAGLLVIAALIIALVYPRLPEKYQRWFVVGGIMVTAAIAALLHRRRDDEVDPFSPPPSTNPSTDYLEGVLVNKVEREIEAIEEAAADQDYNTLDDLLNADMARRR